MKSIAIMQPTFLPWVGYFDLLDQVDEFIFLDNVQFEKQSWQQRNRILGSCGLKWMTVPVLSRGRFGQKICNVEIKTADFPVKQLKTIMHNYSRAPYFEEHWDELQTILLSVKTDPSLLRMNMKLICWLSKCFRIDTNFRMASEIESSGGRAERLVAMIKVVGATQYISPIGAATYLQQDQYAFSDAGIDIKFQNYVPRPYRQLQPAFILGASALDILFNEGPAASEIIRSGRGQLQQFKEICCEKTNVI